MKRLILALMVGALMATTGCAEIQQRIVPDRASSGVWLSEAEIDALPTSGAAWEQVVDAASGFGGAGLSCRTTTATTTSRPWRRLSWPSASRMPASGPGSTRP